MKDKTPEERLRALLAELSGKDVSGLGIDDDLVRELGFDSLAGLRVLAAVEMRFDVTFPDDRLGEYRTMGKLLQVIGETRGGP